MKRNFNSLNNFSIRQKQKLITYACFDKKSTKSRYFSIHLSNRGDIEVHGTKTKFTSVPMHFTCLLKDVILF